MSDLQRALTGAHRPSSNPRIHRLNSPYNRRSSVGLAGSSTMGDLASLANGSDSPTKSSTKPAPSSRVQSLSNPSGGMTRSGSESSLFSAAKSLFTRSFWGSTPAKATAPQGSKRDSLSSFGHDLEDPESPSDKRDGKRRRRFSPERKLNGIANHESDYEPERPHEVQGRALTGYMLPSLAPHVTLKPRQSGADKPLPSHPTNFSRPLTSSQSMPYLDPPSRALRSSGTLKSTASPRKAGVLTRSKRVDLASLGNDELEEEGVLVERPESSQEKEQWSPWSSKYGATGAAASAAAVPRGSTPRKSSALVDYAMPSASPFRLPPASPRPRQFTTSGLTRSATTANLGRQSSVVSDVSMASGSRPLRSTSIRNLREPEVSSVFGGSVIGDEDSMSIDGDSVRRREGSVLDWFMKDRWDKPGAPASVASSRRLTSAAPSSSSTIRKGQMVWNQEDKVFVRESELKASQHPNPIHKNEAERILYTLEAMRKTPLTDARKGDLPPLLGQSSRTLRKTINVPLATAAAGESAKQRRDKERLGDSVSVMISPYGRRNVADREAKEVKRQSRAEDQGRRLSATPSDARSDTASNIDVDSAASRDSRSPAPPTPRRSSRLKRGTTAEEETTPKASRRSTRRGNSAQPEPIAEETPAKRSSRRTRKTTVDRGTSPEPPPPVPEVPVITATAPSPSGPSLSNYQPRTADEMPRGSSSLRAKSDSKRAHQSAATYSRGQTPSSGRYSAKDEDLPDMEELEQASKISLPSFSGITFGNLNAGAPAPKAAAPVAPQPPLSLPRAGGPLARLGVASTRPRASSPLAGGSIVAAPDSPPTFPPPKKDDVQPPAGGIFPLFNNTDKPAEKPTSSLTADASSASQPPASSFFSKPPTPKETPAAEKPAFSFSKPAGETDGGIPDFFGKKSASSTPAPSAPVPTFSFGVKKTTEEKAPPAQLPSFGAPSSSGSGSPAPFSFGAPAAGKKEEEKKTNGTAAPFSFGGSGGGEKKEDKNDAAPAGGFNFGASKESSPAPAASSPFSFNAPKPTEPAAKPAFSFGAPAEKPKTDEAPKAAFSFGAPPAPAEKPAESAATPFSFGTPAAPSSPAPKPAFSFGAASGTTTPASTPPPTFGAVKDGSANGSTTPVAAPAFGGFNFGKAEKPAEKPTSTFTFGAGGGDKPNGGTSSPFGAPATNGEAPKNPFGGSSTPAAGSSTPSFTFGAPSSTGTSKPAGAFGSAAPAAKPFSFGAPPNAPAAAPANPFGANNAAKPSTSSFTFGANNTAAPASTPFGSTAPTSNPFGQQTEQKASSPAPFTFGAPAPTPSPSTSTFGFGQPANNAPAAPTSTFGFGQASQPAAPSPSAPAFSFGAPAAAPAAAPFSFGAPAGDAASRFKSPTPGPDAGAGNGFSLGIAANETPSSPGGRRVRGLPKRR